MIDHSQCEHESSKAARARCRRERTAAFELSDLNPTAEMCMALLAEYGLHDWEFGWDSSLRRFGHCIWLKSGQKLIQLSAPLTRLCSPEQTRWTMLHEISHALVGRGHGHDDVWKAKCVELGIEPSRLFKGYNDMPVKTRYTLVCDDCGKTWHRHREGKTGWSGWICKRCHPLTGAYLRVEQNW